MKLSIIIVTYNTRELTVACIKSIFKNKPKFDFEVIVVDNGSTDNSVKAIQLALSMPKGHPELAEGSLRIIKNKSNLGFSKANNQGIKISKGKYVLLLNSDTEVTKNAIDELVNFAEKHDDAGVIGSQLLNKDGSIQPSVFYLPTLTRTVKQFWFKQKNYLDKYAPKSDKPVEVEAVVGASFLITPQAREKVGLLNESYFMFFEDLEYCKKVRETGLKVYYLPGSRVYHYHGASGKNVTDSDNQWRRLIPSSKTYHGLVKYYLIYFIIKSSQIAAKLVKVIKK